MVLKSGYSFTCSVSRGQGLTKKLSEEKKKKITWID